MTDIFEEVDQSLREDRIGKIWKKYSLFAYAVIVIAIVGVGVWEFLKWQRSEEISKVAKVYDAAVVAREKNDLAAARSDFSQTTGGTTGFSVLAPHMLAGVEDQLTNDQAAVEKFLAQAAAANKGTLGEIALLKLAYSQADTAPIAELEKTLKPLLDKTGDNKGYTPALARELIASKALADGDVERARDEFESLELEINAPRAMKERVARALSTLPPRVVNLNGPTPAATTPAPAAVPATPPATPSPAKPQQ